MSLGREQPEAGPGAEWLPRARFERLSVAVKDLTAARTHDAIVDIVRHAARDITGALGVAIVLREGDACHYIAEDSAVPLWAGQRFPLSACISGWAMIHGRQVVIRDIYADDRIPHDAYRPTGIHSLVMTPVGEPTPFAALGAYWKDVRDASQDETSALSALTSCMATALENMRLMESLREEARRAETSRAELRFQADLLDAVGEAVIATDSEARVTFWNRAAESLYGWTSAEAMGRPILDLTPAPEDSERSNAILAALQRGEAWSGESRLRRRDGATFPALITDTVVHDADGALVGFIGVSRDISERHRADAHKQLLINELNHRVKNTLAIVQSLAAQTLRGDRPVAAAREDFDARLIALSDVHGLMTEAEWRAVPVAELIARATRPFASDGAARFDLEGPEVLLGPKAAVAFALALHELCTNAVKYGGLSTAGGGVSVRWTLGGGAGAPRLALTWRETGGPPVVAPTVRGFGSRLLERGLADELQGQVRLVFAPDGLVCEMDIGALWAGDAGADLFPLPN